MPSFGALRERHCPRCGREVDLPLGALCDECRARIARRARGIARRVSLASVALFGVWAWWRVPPDPNARLVAGLAALAIWLIIRTITFRTVREWLS
jgi:hypothetical protein